MVRRGRSSALVIIVRQLNGIIEHLRLILKMSMRGLIEAMPSVS